MNGYTDQKLFNSLKELAFIPDKELISVFQESEKEKKPFIALLLKKNLISNENLGQVVSELMNLPFIRLSDTSINLKLIQDVPENFAIHQRFLAFQETDDEIFVATPNPENNLGFLAFEKKFEKPIKLHYTTHQDFEETLLLYKKDLARVFNDIIRDEIGQAEKNDKNEPPIIKIVDTIFLYAHQRKTSDIHIEAMETRSLIRFRIDGVLHDIAELPIDLHSRIITRIKVLSKLRTDEHQAAQDGKLTFRAKNSEQLQSKNLNKDEASENRGEKIDIRVSIVPSTDGEKVVMRLLAAESRSLSLEDLGFNNHDLKRITSAYKKPHGMILATGPTGSGKTTSMYALLKLLNKREVNISTIEDPVEYDIEGITQIQVNNRTSLTFSQGLKSIVRQDPDIILVGEIRDTETANIAINAAMTGHLVLSTLHTNDAATAVPRLIDMGIEPFLIASTINVVIAQRLVRQIHIKCRISQEVELDKIKQYFSRKTVKKHFGTKDKIRVYKGAGCDICHHTGYEGRVGIYEILDINDDVRQAIVDKQDASVIKQIAVKNGMTTMIDDGLEKVRQGITTMEELVRVTKD